MLLSENLVLENFNTKHWFELFTDMLIIYRVGWK
jgi:hypothetical protein